MTGEEGRVKGLGLASLNSFSRLWAVGCSLVARLPPEGRADRGGGCGSRRGVCTWQECPWRALCQPRAGSLSQPERFDKISNSIIYTSEHTRVWTTQPCFLEHHPRLHSDASWGRREAAWRPLSQAGMRLSPGGPDLSQQHSLRDLCMNRGSFVTGTEKSALAGASWPRGSWSGPAHLGFCVLLSLSLLLFSTVPRQDAGSGRSVLNPPSTSPQQGKHVPVFSLGKPGRTRLAQSFGLEVP